MKIETIVYWSKRIKEIRDQLPDYVINSAIIQLPYHQQKDLLEINFENQAAIAYLDKELNELLSSSKYTTRRHHIEITENEISKYTIFSINPEQLEYGRYTFGNCRIPDCGGYYPGSPSQCCTVGEELLSPVKVKKKKAAKLDMAQLHYGGKNVVLLISARIKRIFDIEGITGLVYEPAGFLDSVRKVDYHKADGISYITYKEIVEEDSPAIEPPYLARIPQSIYSKADEVFIYDTVCPVHRMFRFKNPTNLSVVPEGVCVDDFFQVQGVDVKGQPCDYQFNEFYISRKVLELLLKHKATRGFQKGPFFKKTFSPLC